MSYLDYKVFRPDLELQFESRTLPQSVNTFDMTAKPDAYTAASYTGGSAFTDLTSVGGNVFFQGRNKAALISYNSLPAKQIKANSIEYVVSVNFKIENLFINNAAVSNFCGAHFSGGFSDEIVFEPIYEILVDSKVVGLYLKIADCRSTSSATDKVVTLGFKIDSVSGFTGSTYSLTLTSSIR